MSRLAFLCIIPSGFNDPGRMVMYDRSCLRIPSPFPATLTQNKDKTLRVIMNNVI